MPLVLGKATGDEAHATQRCGVLVPAVVMFFLMEMGDKTQFATSRDGGPKTSLVVGHDGGGDVGRLRVDVMGCTCHPQRFFFRGAWLCTQQQSASSALL